MIDHSAALIAIQEAKDKASQACREKKWLLAFSYALDLEAHAKDLVVWIEENKLNDPR